MKFKNTYKMNKMRSDWSTEELLYNKFEQRMKNHHGTISNNDKLIQKMKEKESEYLEKLNKTLEKQNTISTF